MGYMLCGARYGMHDACHAPPAHGTMHARSHTCLALADGDDCQSPQSRNPETRPRHARSGTAPASLRVCSAAARICSGCSACPPRPASPPALAVFGALLCRTVQLRGWRNTVGNLFEIVWLKQNYHEPQLTGVRMKQRGVRFHRTRDFKQYNFNSIPPTSQ